MNEVIATVSFYKGFLLIIADMVASHKDWVPIGPGKVGCVLMDTAKHLAISKEALDFLREVKRGPDAIGDVMWFKSDYNWVFGWCGDTRYGVHSSCCVGDRDFEVPPEGNYVLVENAPPIEAILMIDSLSEEEPKC